MDLGIQGKVALITGGSEGIGKATAVRLATEGANVVICARRPDILREAADEISNISNMQVLAIPTDVSDPSQIDALVNEVVSEYGKIDILISNAGQGAVQPFALLDDNVVCHNTPCSKNTTSNEKTGWRKNHNSYKHRC